MSEHGPSTSAGFGFLDVVSRCAADVTNSEGENDSQPLSPTAPVVPTESRDQNVTTATTETPLVDEKLMEEQRAVECSLGAGSAQQDDADFSRYADDPPSYSVYVIDDGSRGRRRARANPAADIYEEPKSIGNELEMRIETKAAGAIAEEMMYESISSGTCRGCSKQTRKKIDTPEEAKADVDDETEDELPEMKTWRQFTSTTTMHGIKYVFEDRPFTVRKMLWLICVMTCVILFAYQAIDRVCNYFRYKSNVDVEIKYVDELEFPAVTVCNYNNFRLTEVVDRRLHNFIESVFRTENSGVQPFSVDSLSQSQLHWDYENEINSVDGYNETYEEFVLRTAHQKNDFIYSCTWQGVGCSDVVNWTTTLTDFGVCYTFNGETDPAKRLSVTRSGSQFALSLTLNIEQYEYMAGPHQEAGVKVLLHDPFEVAQVKDFGFAIAPGTHNLAVVQQQTVNSLEPPYGECNNMAPLRSHCLANCQAERIWQTCQCRDVYMPVVAQPEQTDVVCNMNQSFFCVNANLAVLVRDYEAGCRCPVRCHQVLYEPELSNAQLSKLAFDRLFLYQPERKIDLDTKYQKARETAERVDSTLVLTDLTLIADVVDTSEAYIQAVNNTLLAMTYDSYFRKQYGGAGHQLIDNYKMAIVDLMSVNDTYYNKAKICMTSLPLLPTDDLTTQLKFITDQTQYVDNCVALQANLTSVNTCNSSLSPCAPLKANDSWCSESSTASYSSYFLYNNMMSKTQPYVNDLLQQFTDTKTTYLNYVSLIFDNTTTNVSAIADHVTCLEYIYNVTSFWRPQLIKLNDTLNAYVRTCCWQTKRNLIRAVQNFLDLTGTSSWPNKNEFNNYAACRWYRRSSWTDVISDAEYGWFTVNLNAAIQGYLVTSPLHPQLVADSQSLLATANRYRDFFLQPLDKFIASGLTLNFTKMQMYDYFQSTPAELSPESAQLTNERFVSGMQTWINQLNDLQTTVQNFYNKAYDVDIPPMDVRTVTALWIVGIARQQAVAGSTTDAKQLAVYVDDLMNPFGSEAGLLGIVSTFYGGYVKAMQQMQQQVQQTFQNMQAAQYALLANLNEFYADGQLDGKFLSNNFIKLDVYYKELSYEYVGQQITFDLLSLFSEIGGLLGLLLGSSVLTVCELVDFIATVVSIRLESSRRGRRKKHDLQSGGKRSAGESGVVLVAGGAAAAAVVVAGGRVAAGAEHRRRSMQF